MTISSVSASFIRLVSEKCNGTLGLSILEVAGLLGFLGHLRDTVFTSEAPPNVVDVVLSSFSEGFCGTRPPDGDSAWAPIRGNWLKFAPRRSPSGRLVPSTARLHALEELPCRHPAAIHCCEMGYQPLHFSDRNQQLVGNPACAWLGLLVWL